MKLDTGVYYILNRVNGKCYVGSSTTSLQRRLKDHRRSLRRGTHENSYLQRAWNKYGESSFLFLILERCEPRVCLVREQHWIDKMRSRGLCYNLCPVAGNCMGGRKHTLESRVKMSTSKLGRANMEATTAAALVNTGTPRSAETRAKISSAQKGRKMSAVQRAVVKRTHWSHRPDAAEIVERIAAKNRGKSHSAEHRAKISAGLLRFHAGIAQGTATI
jgi:group I intron endonuclease